MFAVKLPQNSLLTLQADAVICYLLFKSLYDLDTVRISNVQCVIKYEHWTQATASIEEGLLNLSSTFSSISRPEKSIVDIKLSVLKISKFYAKVEWESVKI